MGFYGLPIVANISFNVVLWFPALDILELAKQEDFHV